ncbi:MAG: hypothetical protein AAF570_27810, partial [Bacteroidota bacterium]
MNQIAFRLLSLLWLLSLPFSATATHVLGGGIHYSCTGHEAYEVRLELLIDDGGQAPPDDSVSIFFIQSQNP